MWKEEGLKVPDKQRKRRRLAKLEGASENGCARRRAEHKYHAWSYDFVMDRTEDGRRLKNDARGRRVHEGAPGHRG